MSDSAEHTSAVREGAEMNPGVTPEAGWAGSALNLPARPRRRLWGAPTALLVMVIAGAACFYAGVRVEKGQVSGASTGSGLGGGTPTGFASRAANLLGGSGNAAFGTVSSIGHGVIDLTEASGNVIEVKVVSATTITKSLPVGRHALRPGDSVVVRGVKNAEGKLVAASVSDSGSGGGGRAGGLAALFGGAGGGSTATGGAGGGSTASGGGTHSSGGTNAKSAVNSLFGGG